MINLKSVWKGYCLVSFLFCLGLSSAAQYFARINSPQPVGDSANVVIKPDDLSKCIAVLTAHSMELVKAIDLYLI